MLIRNRSFVTASILVVALAAARPALAGPPLLCHPFDIGSATSLPWNGTSSWFDGKADYKLTNLVSDTESLLGAGTPVIVRMETLRRASIYASHDPDVAAALLDRLARKALKSNSDGHPDALAFLDAAYATEALRQVVMIGGVTGYKDRVGAINMVLKSHDGWSYMKASLAARPDDPSLQFAAALIVADKDRSAYLALADRARAGANKDALLARNLNHIS